MENTPVCSEPFWGHHGNTRQEGWRWALQAPIQWSKKLTWMYTFMQFIFTHSEPDPHINTLLLTCMKLTCNEISRYKRAWRNKIYEHTIVTLYVRLINVGTLVYMYKKDQLAIVLQGSTGQGSLRSDTNHLLPPICTHPKPCVIHNVHVNINCISNCV